MQREAEYYVLKKAAVPEALLKVVEVQRLLAENSKLSVSKASKQAGLSRSSYYKYKDDIFPFHENAKGNTVTFDFLMEDRTGLLAEVLGIIANSSANVLTIHQSIPISGMASLCISIEVLKETRNISQIIGEIEQCSGVRQVRILAKE